MSKPKPDAPEAELLDALEVHELLAVVAEAPLSLDEIATMFGVPRGVIWKYRQQAGRTERKPRPAAMVEFEGSQVSLKELSSRCNVSYRTLARRYREGARGVALVGRKRGG